MENRPHSPSNHEESIDANPLITYPQLTHDEIYNISELLRELIDMEFDRSKKMTPHEKDLLIEKFKDEKKIMLDMPDDEFIEYIRSCKKGSPSFAKLQSNPHLALAIQEKLLPLIPRI